MIGIDISKFLDEINNYVQLKGFKPINRAAINPNNKGKVLLYRAEDNKQNGVLLWSWGSDDKGESLVGTVVDLSDDSKQVFHQWQPSESSRAEYAKKHSQSAGAKSASTDDDKPKKQRRTTALPTAPYQVAAVAAPALAKGAPVLPKRKKKKLNTAVAADAPLISYLEKKDFELRAHTDERENRISVAGDIVKIHFHYFDRAGAVQLALQKDGVFAGQSIFPAREGEPNEKKNTAGAYLKEDYPKPFFCPVSYQPSLSDPALSTLYLCEGWATAMAVDYGIQLSQADGEVPLGVAICCFGVNNIVPIADKAIALGYKVVLCTDFDAAGNIKGYSRAYPAAGFDDYEGLDFDDIYRKYGTLKLSITNTVESVARYQNLNRNDVAGLLKSVFPLVKFTCHEKGFPYASDENVDAWLRAAGFVPALDEITKNSGAYLNRRFYSFDLVAAAMSSAWSTCTGREMTRTLSGCLKSWFLPENGEHKNPLKDWILAGNPARGEVSFDKFKKCFRGDNDFEFLHHLLLDWADNAVMTWCGDQPYMNRAVLVLQGPQYVGKTSFFKKLIPSEWFLPGRNLHVENKDSVIQILSHGLVELGEFEATLGKSDIGKLKAFVTNDKDNYRTPYATTADTYIRRTVLVASVNDPQFLNDPTGSTRYSVVNVNSFDFELLSSISFQDFWAWRWSLVSVDPTLIYRSPEFNEKHSLNNVRFSLLDPIEMGVASYFEPAANYLLSSREACENLSARGIGDRVISASMLKRASMALTKHFGAPKKMRNKVNNKTEMLWRAYRSEKSQEFTAYDFEMVDDKKNEVGS